MQSRPAAKDCYSGGTIEIMPSFQLGSKMFLMNSFDNYRKKVEQELEDNKSRGFWDCVEAIKGHNTREGTAGMTVEKANKLNSTSLTGPQLPHPHGSLYLISSTFTD